MPELIDCVTGTERISAIFSSANMLRAMLDFEVALAEASAACGVIPAAAVDEVRRAADPARIDLADLSRAAFRAGTPVIPLAQLLRQQTPYAHWGATSHDVSDTALILKLHECRDVLAADHIRLVAALTNVSREHAGTVMLGRTLMQPALPVTFGLKSAAWLAALRRGWQRCESRFDEAFYLQFGGACGTLADFGEHGLAVSERLAAALGLKLPDAPWHGHRDRLAALVAAVSIYVGSLAKMALDVALLMQWEVGEASEPGGDGRGGSSAMPHKRNPTACLLTLAAAKRTPGLLADFVAGMVQEHERGLGGWQNEWHLMHQVMQAAGVAVESMREVAEGLSVDASRMRANVKSTGLFSEPEAQLGSAETFRRRLLGEE